MNVTLAQIVLAVSIPTTVAMIGLLFSIMVNNRLADRVEKMGDTLNAAIDQQAQSFQGHHSAVHDPWR